ncbi:MAG: ABC transporter ATP-binding protein, partial [Anaerolineae bacterium]|nr:ABC transporter ATP-binding protein [Anaerolineae bacterium]
MLRLAKYLKPFLLMLIITLFLLFVQAMSNLTLPDYMARIVNVGIQQSGIENAVPDAIRQSQMNELILFMTEDEQTQVLQQYTLVDQQSDDYQHYVKDYPTLAEQPIYVLDDVSDEDIDQLNPVMGTALLALSGASRAAEGETPVDPADLPAEARQQIRSTIEQKYATMGTSSIIQAAAALLKAEYVALGVDTDDVQN